MLEGNPDLLDRAGELLTAMGADGTLTLELEVDNLDRADVYVDDRPRGSVEVTGDAATVVTGVTGARSARVEGFSNGELVAALLRCASPGQTEVASSTRDQIAKVSSSDATDSRLLVGSSTASS